MGKFYGNWITFNVYGRTSKRSLDRALWFERVMDSFDWYFKVNGFRLIEEGMGGRERIEIGDDKLPVTKYSLSYFVRSDDTYTFGTQELKKLIITADVRSKEG